MQTMNTPHAADPLLRPAGIIKRMARVAYWDGEDREALAALASEIEVARELELQERSVPSMTGQDEVMEMAV